LYFISRNVFQPSSSLRFLDFHEESSLLFTFFVGEVWGAPGELSVLWQFPETNLHCRTSSLLSPTPPSLRQLQPAAAALISFTTVFFIRTPIRFIGPCNALPPPPFTKHFTRPRCGVTLTDGILSAGPSYEINLRLFFCVYPLNKSSPV